MAMTSYGPNSPEAVKLWSRSLWHESFSNMYFRRFLGSDKKSLVQYVPDPAKSAGDQVTCTLRKPLDGPGVLGDSTLEGNEEQLKTFTDELRINQLRNAHRSKGKMSEQRVPWSVRKEGKDALSDWFTERLEIAFFNQLCGFNAQNDLRLTGHNTPVAPDLRHYMWAGNDNPGVVDDAAIPAGQVLTLDTIDCLVTKAQTMRSNGSARIRPIRVGNTDHYVLFIHPENLKQMRIGLGNTRWQELQLAAVSARNQSSNPLYTGAAGIYNNTVIHTSEYVTYGVGANGVVTDAINPATAGNAVRRGVFAGAQSMAYAVGKGDTRLGMSNYEELFDYGNQLGQSCGAIFGLKKVQYDNEDFGTITVGIRDQ